MDGPAASWESGLKMPGENRAVQIPSSRIGRIGRIGRISRIKLRHCDMLRIVAIHCDDVYLFVSLFVSCCIVL